MIRIEQLHLAVIREAARDGYPEEICGVLLGRDQDGAMRRIAGVASVANARTDERERRYLIPPDAMLQIERAAARDDLEIVGFYHSHPDHPASPSAFDLEHSWPWYTYLIVSVRQGEPAETRAWRMAEDRSSFAEEVMHVED